MHPSTSASTPLASRKEAEEELDSAALGTQADSEGEGLEGVFRKSSQYKLSLEAVDDLLGAIYTTLGIQAHKK